VIGLAGLMTGPGAKAAGIGFGGVGGYVSMRMGDTQGWFQTYKDFCDDTGRTSALGSFQSKILYGGEARLSLTENFGLRFGYHRLSGEQSLEVTVPFVESFAYQVSAHAISGSLILGMRLESFNSMGVVDWATTWLLIQ